MRSTARCGILRRKALGRSVESTYARWAPMPLKRRSRCRSALLRPWRHRHATNATRPLLKIKLGGDGDIERMAAVAEAAPNPRIILDANEGWNCETIWRKILMRQRQFGIALIEQPLPADDDASLREVPHAVPICADESLHGVDGAGQACRSL